MPNSVWRVIPDFIRSSYAVKFAIVLFLLGFSVGAIGYVGTDLVAGTVQEQVDDDQKQLAAQEAANIEQWTERNHFFASDVATGVEGAADVGAYLEQRKADEDGVHDVHHVDLESLTIAHSTNDELAGQPITAADETWAAVDLAAVERAGGDVTETPLTGTAHDGTPVLYYVDYVGDGDEMVVLVIDVYQYVDRMITSDGAATYAVYDGDPGAVLDDERTESDEPMLQSEPVVVMDTASEAFFEPYDTGIDFTPVGREPIGYEFDAAPDPLDASVGEDYHDEAFLVTTAQVLDGSDFYVVVHTPTSEAYGVVEDVSTWGIYASIAGIVLVVLVGGVMGRHTSRSIDRLTSKAERMEDGDLDVSFETDRIDSIGRLYDGFASMRDSLREQIRAANEARADAEQARAETERTNRHLESKVGDYREVMRACADGDLTARMDPESENEAMEAIGREFNETVAEIEETTAQLKAFATQVATASEAVTASSEEVRSASEQVTASVQEIADGADRQNESLQSVDHEMNGLSTTIEEIAAASNQVADLAARTVETGRRGQQAAEAAIDGMSEIDDESRQAVAEIERLEEEMAQIDDLIEFISEVAEQTNMLALNANIEASRSQSGDDGFSVVAGEVKDLASETKDAADDIEARLERIQAQTERAATEVQRTSSRVAEHTDSIERAADALEEITDYAAETSDGVQGISAATEEQAASTQEVVAMVDEVATIAEETAAETDTVATAAEEQTAALTEVSENANDLATQATRLTTALDRFETDVDGFETGSDRFETDADAALEVDDATDAATSSAFETDAARDDADAIHDEAGEIHGQEAEGDGIGDDVFVLPDDSSGWPDGESTDRVPDRERDGDGDSAADDTRDDAETRVETDTETDGDERSAAETDEIFTFGDVDEEQ